MLQLGDAQCLLARRAQSGFRTNGTGSVVCRCGGRAGAGGVASGGAGPGVPVLGAAPARPRARFAAAALCGRAVGRGERRPGPAGPLPCGAAGGARGPESRTAPGPWRERGRELPGLAGLCWASSDSRSESALCPVRVQGHSPHPGKGMGPPGGAEGLGGHFLTLHNSDGREQPGGQGRDLLPGSKAQEEM